MLNWYALQVRSSCEGLVEKALAFYDIESYYPARMVPVARLHHQKVERLVRKPWFPGYVFAHLDWDAALFRPLVSIPQVVRVVGVGDEPLAIPDSEIESVRLVIAAPVKATVCPYLAVGDRVLVSKGPLAGTEGFVMYLKGTVRVVVSIDLLRQSVSAEVDRADIEVLPGVETKVA